MYEGLLKRRGYHVKLYDGKRMNRILPYQENSFIVFKTKSIKLEKNEPEE